MKMADISVDAVKCSDPLACRKCLLACPTMVLSIKAKKAPVKYRELDVNDFVVQGVNPLACSGCMDCVKTCPTKAIQISFN